MLNNCSFEGYIANELTFVSKDSTQYCKFLLAIPRNYKDDNDSTPADFIPCIAFGASGERIALNFVKGKRITVTGRMESSRYEDEQGKNHHRLVLNISEWYFGDRKPTPPHSIEDLNISDEELPFES